MFLTPLLVGGGKQFLPEDLIPELERLGDRRFGRGIVYLRYGVDV